ncbi:MAG: energy-coupling factor transporter ATPase [Candidatus Caldatribacterium sp.]|uniref:energy-coupling factor transporter ATPase n=1 Tax=Candidatus Caldatribacterium sp. TaxID=2282143 RepID=UPI002999555E|nr:energy-coupling factor transporter ATPase [Candidatus Caldatribacterium sp.]MCX7729932.1 energy-coupling factor transporter ATPase [Candidatus Caldatribacterium sp.]MDW8082063.1 energy-coupling factor transporter ATPase [Candidatus Calescibacterium sp.]
MFILVENVSFTYLPNTPFAVRALWNVSLTIERGESIAILGRTGCGKSTLVQHLNGLLIPQEGRVVVDGVDTRAKGAPLREIRRKVGLVFQYPEDQMFEETVFREVAFAPRNMGVEGEELEDRVRWAMTVVGLDYDALKDKSPFELSGGQMRRVAIASILSMKPEVLVLDEPTAGLDPQGRTMLLEKLWELRKQWGLTVILVSHNVEDVARIAERVVVLERGRIVFDGPIREFFADEERMRQCGILPSPLLQAAFLLRKKGFAVPPPLVPFEFYLEVKEKVLARKRSCSVEA